MISYIYTFFIVLYKLTFRIVAIFNSKAKSRVSQLRVQSYELTKSLTHLSKERILVHCASLGEYEQVKPIIQWIISNTKYDIVVSFFSPSGYENCELIPGRILKCYLPFDLKSNLSEFISDINPTKVIITKNEWWWNLLQLLKQEKIPTYLVSSTIRSNHYFIRYPLLFFKNRIAGFDSIFVVNQASKVFLSQIYSSTIINAGDTRKDQVLNIKDNQNQLTTEYPTVVYGSVWASDLHIIKEVIRLLPKYKHLIYPHDLSNGNLEKLRSSLDCKILADVPKDAVLREDGTFIINSMGQLKKDYARASLSYIGGGFDQGIHNILEAIVYGAPAIFGPRYHKSEEAKELIEHGVVFSVLEASEIKQIIQFLSQPIQRDEINLKLKAYFSASKSATNLICSEIFQKQDQ